MSTEPDFKKIATVIVAERQIDLAVYRPNAEQTLEMLAAAARAGHSACLARKATTTEEKQAPALTVAGLDGTADEADWITAGHTLDAHEVAYIRSLIIP
jgi:hypothetical protein